LPILLVYSLFRAEGIARLADDESTGLKESLPYWQVAQAVLPHYSACATVACAPISRDGCIGDKQ